MSERPCFYPTQFPLPAYEVEIKHRWNNTRPLKRNALLIISTNLAGFSPTSLQYMLLMNIK